MKNEQKYISLKEAAQISGYSPDYIGYLIRSGKIPGKQVYCNIAWMTTAEAVLGYKQREQKKGENKIGFKDKILDFFRETKQKILWEIKILKLFTKTFRYVLPIIIILILSFSALIFFIFSIKFQKNIPEARPAIEEQKMDEQILIY
jgi:hypothetical protein